MKKVGTSTIAIADTTFGKNCSIKSFITVE
ncbi:MAG: hypothetical protein UU76_C0018G0002 [Parcubacteria group bacterium GW2011_GWC1_41_7]|nr:MAG: hypothetical protein UU76_C0018G0002 [Parcubacteria group bacterium GW2011_GWC1_41_7]